MPVGLDDPLDELVPDDVVVRELDERDAVDRAEDVAHRDQARRLARRQVDLRDVAGDDDLRAEAEARQEHLHLLGARVLRLVEDDEGVVDRAATHVGQRRDLDRALLHVGGQPVGVEHVVERVVQRAQVRVDLREQVAGQEAEPLAGLDRGAREDDAADLALGQRRDGERHRQVGLAGAGRADPERDRVVADRVDVALLVDRLRRDLRAAMAPDDVVEDVADVLGLVERAEHRVDRGRADLVPALDQLDELVDDRARLGDVRVVALERQLVPAQADRAVEALAERSEHAVAHAGELGGDVVGDRENFLQLGHSVGAGVADTVSRKVTPSSTPPHTRDVFDATLAVGRRPGTPGASRTGQW